MPSMIVAPQPIAAEEGARVLMRGGNAIDAALTCAMVQTVVDPQMCGIGGYALVNMHLAGGSGPLGIDAPALAGSKARPDMWLSKFLGLNPDGWGYFVDGKVNDAGYQSICIPGTVKMFAHLLEKHGTLTWAEILAPAARIAEQGFPVNAKLVQDWRTKAPYPEACSMLELIQRNPEASRIFLKPGGEVYDMGETLRNPDYARTLRDLAVAGPEDLYRGQLARRITQDLGANGANVTADDLARYRLVDAPPVSGRYRGHDIASATAPHGGATVVAILNILEGWDLAGLGHNSPEYIYRVSMAMKAAFADRNQFMADPAFERVPVAWMTSPQRAAEWRAHIDAGKPIEAMPVAGEHPDTTHVTVVDRHGNCVALTHSLGNSSGVVTPGLGFIYNNSMINFDPRPGGPNSIAPGKGRTTGMAPTIVYRDGQPVLVLGAPGASRIITSVLQVILNVLDFGMSISDAVLEPRFDCQVNMIRCQRRIPGYVLDAVRTRHPIDYIPFSHGGMGRVHAIAIDPRTGRLTGAADTGSDGMALETV